MDDHNAARIIAAIRRIPEGRVATYGQIAKLAGLPRNARQVGAVLKSLGRDTDVPWHRVVNSQGRISRRGDATFEGLQRYALEHEGVEFSDTERINLIEFQWNDK